MTHLLDYLADQVLLCDGPIGTQVQARNLDIERDFHGHENCTDILCDSRPDLVLEIHRDYLAAGCEAVQTNSFGASPVTLGEFGIADRAFELNRRSAELAREMAEHVKWLGDNWPGYLSVLPNAGLPELINGHTHYPLTPRELAQWLERFVLEDGVNMIGGCCGSEAAHIAALDQMLRRIGRDRPRPVPKQRQPQWTPSVASLYSQVALRQENAYLSIGERCNANGSRAFRRRQEQGDWDGCVEMGREQVKEGSHTLDVCTAFVGRDEIAEMSKVVSRMRGSINAPLVIDSTEYPVLEAAMKLYGGKPIINSINFEDGEEAADKRLKLARRFGAAVIALTIDESGMAKEADHKLRLAERLYDFACTKHGLPPSDLLFDPLTFTICTGNADDRKLGLNTLDAIAAIAERMPECQIILGLSNISFGLNPPARQVLNSVFLDHALRRGLTGAIVHFSKILPLHRIPEEEARVAEDLIFDRRHDGYDPLRTFMALFQV